MTSTRRFLVQDVVLRNGAEQYSAFREFVLLHDLTRHVRYLTIGIKVIRAVDDETFSSSLTGILEKAEQLRGFSFEGCICSFPNAAQIVSALVDRPLSALTLCKGLQLFRDINLRPISGLRVLYLGHWGCKISDSSLSILSNILTNIAHTLESLMVPYLDNRFSTILCPHVHTLHVGGLAITAEELARAFPHL
ncbi:hypothetical protein EW146_g10213 [Bondarzewia mesenterica]|uniref:Uncharacterized protein n=1 Tax=Bondarzewia mesenterica TaxID=1095465 RepID=A0A4S4L176_9AGAM|nr:hypothetical protein EW146_g10213 [Bondarzewia mesenterica]